MNTATFPVWHYHSRQQNGLQGIWGGGTTTTSQNFNHYLSTYSLLQDIFLSAYWVQPCIKPHGDASCELGSQIK